MNLLLFLNSDIHSATALRLLSPQLQNHKVKIILSKKVGNVANLPAELLAMKDFEQQGVEEMFLELSEKIGAEINSFANVNSPEALAVFREFSPDLIISVRFGQIFKDALIATSRYGVLNLHSGILPNYRGILASFWAVLNGEEYLGTTLHFVRDAGIDTGDIIAFSRSKINREASLVENINHLYHEGCELISQALTKISRGEKITTIEQKTLGAGNYFSYPNAQDIAKFLPIMRLI